MVAGHFAFAKSTDAPALAVQSVSSQFGYQLNRFGVKQRRILITQALGDSNWGGHGYGLASGRLHSQLLPGFVIFWA